MDVICILDESIQGSGAHLAVKCADLSPHTFVFDDELTVGGIVKSMAWDPLGERLAVIFEGRA